MSMRGKGDTLFKVARLVTIAGAAALVLTLGAGTALMQSAKPYTKDVLLKVVRLNALPTAEIVDRINQRGVEFRVDSETQQEFVSAGARPEMIDAMRRNFRSAAPPPSNSGNPPSTSRPPANVPAGAPLSKNEIVTLLQSGVPVTRVEQFVEARGVNFSVTPEVAREITAAGGNRSLLGAISEKAMNNSSASSPSSPSNPSRPARNPAEDYDDYTDRAVSAIQANDADTAIRLSQQAIRLDASQSQAYALLGIAQLYGRQDIAAASQSMRAAIERGGAGVFRVYHDHGTGYFQEYCQGSLFVTKANVTFKADDGNHTFEAADANITEAKINGFVGKEQNAFHIKVSQGGGKPQNYNFAPATTKAAESNLIINLIHGFK